MNARSRLTRAAASIILAASLLAMLPVTAPASLPDNRAYELVSSPERGGNLGALFVPLYAVDPSGNRVLIDGGANSSILPDEASFTLRERTAGGWAQVGGELSPPSPPPSESAVYLEASLVAVAGDLSRAAFETGLPADPRDQNVNGDIYTRPVPGAPGDAFTWISGPPAPVVKPLCDTKVEPYCHTAVFYGASTDLSHIFWTEREPLMAPPGALPGSPPDTHTSGGELYEWEGGAQRLAGVLPDRSVPACGAAPVTSENPFASQRGVVSPDGSQALFESPDPQAGCGPGELYMRVNGSSTIQISAPARRNPDPAGPQAKWYVGSANDGSALTHVFFISKEALAEASNTGQADEGADLYEYDTQTGGLTDLTVDTLDSSGANVIGFLGSSTDGSLVYFLADGVLAPGARAGVPNLYVYDAASARTTLIASGEGLQPGMESQATPDGSHLLFVDRDSLTSYDQHGHQEVYLYDAGTKTLTCVSCDPSGAPPSGDASIFATYKHFLTTGSLAMSDNASRVFFESPDVLAPGATRTFIFGGFANENVYEYERGHVQLIVASGNWTSLITTTHSGGDVFFATQRLLLSQDTNDEVDIYDARVDGGFPQPTPPACAGTGCQGVPPAPPIFATPASVTFSGAGNVQAPAARPVGPRRLTRAQRLVRSLRACRHNRQRKRRAACERQARRTYAARAGHANRNGKGRSR